MAIPNNPHAETLTPSTVRSLMILISCKKVAEGKIIAGIQPIRLTIVLESIENTICSSKSYTSAAIVAHYVEIGKKSQQREQER